MYIDYLILATFSYEFVCGIKLDAPSSLKEEFYKLETYK
jgi:hypothetical protein